MTQINQERLVEHFCQLVRIDSESMNEKQIAETLAEQLGELGFTVHKLPVPEHISNGFNMYARLEGKKEGSILMSCHMDTVRRALVSSRSSKTVSSARKATPFLAVTTNLASLPSWKQCAASKLKT